MQIQDICLSCFSPRGGYEVCPYCGFVAGTPNQPAYMLQPGTRLWGRYVIGTVLGIGGFGVTYRAYDTRLASIVAIKEFFPQNLASRIPGETKLRVFSGKHFEAYQNQLARFLDEAKNMAKFTGDAHIVNVFDSFEDNGTAYIVMEFLDGETLKEHLVSRGGSLPPQEAAYIMESLLQALAVIHKKQIIHRDISPDNLFILRDGRVKVLDFGAARFAAKEEWTQSVVVKKGYAPPEQYRSNMKQTACTDLYAAGATWYKMLTGQTPEESIERWEKDTLRRPSTVVQGLDTAPDKAVMKAMALRPELRFQTAEAMLAAVRGQTGFDFPEEELKKRRRAQKLWVAAAVVLVLTTLGVAGWQFSKAPVTISAGPTLADKTIAPDSIVVLVSDYENENGTFDKLAAAFMEQYPQHKVEVRVLPYEQLETIDYSSSEEGAPTVFYGHRGNANENLADLSLLYRGLAMEDYYAMGQYAQRNADDLTDIPTSFFFYHALGSPSAAAAAGVKLPESFTSHEQLLSVCESAPGKVDWDVYEYFNLLEWYHPEVGDYASFTPLAVEKQVSRYASVLTHEQSYSDTFLAVVQGSGWALTDALRRWPQDAKVIPILNDGKILGSATDSFSVNKNASQNRQYVAMLFLRFALSEHGQTLLYVQDDKGLPLNKKAMQNFLQANPLLAPLEPQFDALNREGGNVPYELVDKLRDIGDINNALTDKDAFMKLFLEYVPEN